MRMSFPGPLRDTPVNLITRAGYTRHCIDNGRICFHRRLNNPPFPRYHLFLKITGDGMEVDLHFDQLNMGRKGNHEKEWSYTGPLVSRELERINRFIAEAEPAKQANRPTYPTANQHQNKNEKVLPSTKREAGRIRKFCRLIFFT